VRTMRYVGELEGGQELPECGVHQAHLERIAAAFGFKTTRQGLIDDLQSASMGDHRRRGHFSAADSLL